MIRIIKGPFGLRTTQITLGKRCSITNAQPLFQERNRLGFWKGATIINLCFGYRLRVWRAEKR